MSTAKGDTLFQSNEINVGDKIYITRKGEENCVPLGKYKYLDHLTVKTKDLGRGRFAESFCTYEIVSDDGQGWIVLQEDLENGTLATYAMLSPTDKMELWRREGIDIRDDICVTIPFDEECECHIKESSKAEMNKQKMIEEEMDKRDDAQRFKDRVNELAGRLQEYRENNLEDEYTGGSVNYYKLDVNNPTTEGFAPYTAECNDIIEALDMNYAEGNAFKALWRRAAARKGIKKKGYDGGMYDAEKVKFFGERLIVQSLEEE